MDNDWVKDDWNVNKADNWEDYRQGMTTNLASQTLSSEYVSSMIASAEYSTDNTYLRILINDKGLKKTR